MISDHMKRPLMAANGSQARAGRPRRVELVAILACGEELLETSKVVLHPS